MYAGDEGDAHLHAVGIFIIWTQHSTRTDHPRNSKLVWKYLKPRSHLSSTQWCTGRTDVVGAAVGTEATAFSTTGAQLLHRGPVDCYCPRVSGLDMTVGRRTPRAGASWDLLHDGLVLHELKS